MSAKLPELPYPYEALEPYISKEIMQIHHLKHHQAYVNNLNAALAKETDHLLNQIELQRAIRFNGGGHINHSLFWPSLAADSRKCDGPLLAAIEKTFGSLEKMQERFNFLSLAIQGSGWGWLAYDPLDKRLHLCTTANQDPLVEWKPLLGIDVWEHSYYLQYRNDRSEYLRQIWHVINWPCIEGRFLDYSA